MQARAERERDGAKPQATRAAINKMNIFKFSLLDWIVLAILVYSVAVSWYKGFVREVLGLVTIVTGVILASWFYRAVGGLFKNVVTRENLALFLGFSVIFLATLLAG